MSLKEKDMQYLWHPFTQMKGANILPVVKGEGVYLFDEEGNKYIDAVSSWWVNVHGHSHPYIGEAIAAQFKELEHVIFAGFTHPQAVKAGERLVKILPDPIGKIFFSDNGSTSIEVALKMALQYWWNQDQDRTKVIAFEGAYHGDTFGSMSVSQRSSFTAPFHKVLFEVEEIPTPTDENIEELKMRMRALTARPDVAAFIYEPLVQGVRGMVMHKKEHLNELLAICAEAGVLKIADEVFTGFGRTGSMFSSDHMDTPPDIMCLSKALTGGSMTLGVTAVTNSVYDAFYLDEREKAFLHGHSFTANPLACAAVNANLDLFEKEETKATMQRLYEGQSAFRERIAGHPEVKEARLLGAILAIELATEDGTSYYSNKGVDAYAFFLEKGIVMRPLGNVLIVMPPYCITPEQLEYVHSTIEEYLQ